MAEEVFKNIQVLKGMPVDQFMGTMGFFSAALGMNCTDCHVDESGGSWAKYADDNDLKRTARRMVQMVAAINKGNFAGRQVVTCNTCHRGSSRPNVMPSLGVVVRRAAARRARRTNRTGGGAACQRSRSSTDTSRRSADRIVSQDSPVSLPRAPTRRSTMRKRARSRSLRAPRATHDDRPHPQRRQHDHRRQWRRMDRGARGREARAAARDHWTGAGWRPARSHAGLSWAGQTSVGKWRVGPPALIDDRETIIVQGTTAGGVTATLCFDAKTALLVRLVRFSESPVGRLVTRVDYGDYRDVPASRFRSTGR